MAGRIATAAHVLQGAGLDAVREFASRAYLAARPSSSADPVVTADWDVLVVLDGCRADLYREVVADGDYEALHVGETRQSPGSATNEWLERTFAAADDETVADIAYVSGNPYTDSYLDDDRFALVDPVWQYGWDDDLGTIPPDPITDRAVAVARDLDPARLVVHYMQPHFPCLAVDDDAGVPLAAFGDQQVGVWNDLRFGNLSRDTAWERYRHNLEIVLAEVETLLHNIQADRVAITADHGNAFGERHLYGHPVGVDIPCLREVPWVETAAVDEGTREPEISPAAGDVEAGVVDERLAALGYLT